VKQASWPYCRSKADAELVARRYQDEGAPVVSVMPAAVWGPQDPHFGEGVTRATNVLKRRYPIAMRGGMQIADVRDLAAVLAAVMTPGRRPQRYMVAGHYISLPDLIRTLADLTGRRIPFATFPARFLAGSGRTADVVQRRVRTRLPWDAEGIWVMNCAAAATTRRRGASSRSSPAPYGKPLPTPSGGWSRSDTSHHTRRVALPAGLRQRGEREARMNNVLRNTSRRRAGVVGGRSRLVVGGIRGRSWWR
jgi:hypothetical protein